MLIVKNLQRKQNDVVVYDEKQTEYYEDSETIKHGQIKKNKTCKIRIMTAQIMKNK